MSWRSRAKYHIKRVLDEHRDRGLTADEVMKIVEDSYPFGERRMHPYKVWLREIKELRRTLVGTAPVTSEILRECPACGSKPGEPCRDYAKRWPFGEHWPTIDGFHESRSQGVLQSPLAEEQQE